MWRLRLTPVIAALILVAAIAGYAGASPAHLNGRPLTAA